MKGNGLQSRVKATTPQRFRLGRRCCNEGDVPVPAGEIGSVRSTPLLLRLMRYGIVFQLADDFIGARHIVRIDRRRMESLVNQGWCVFAKPGPNESDGASVVYFAPQGLNGHFQLWQIATPAPAQPAAAAPAPSPARGSQTAKPTPTPTQTPTPSPSPPPQPVQLTSDLDFDATSTIAWHA